MDRDSRCVVTEMPFRGKRFRVLLVTDERGRECEILCEDTATRSLVGDIYTGKVERVMKGIRAAFVKIAGGRTVFLPLEDAIGCVYTRKEGKREEICGGDEILLQIVRDPVGTKDAVASCNLTFGGRFVTLTTAKKSHGISRKLSKRERQRWKDFLASYEAYPFGVIIRTEAAEAGEEAVRAELETLTEKAEAFLRAAIHQTGGQLLLQGEGPLEKRAKQFLRQGEGVVQTDLPGFYQDLLAVMEDVGKSGDENLLLNLLFYDDPSYELYKLAGLPTILERALGRKVWMASGAYLVIDPTEALTAIDVNSGRNQRQPKSSDVDMEEYHLRINLEAAEEIARQLRLRNISGMILVDFINLRSEERRSQVLQCLRRAVAEDPAGVQVLDYTRLQLVEMTRKKTYPPLARQICPCEAASE